MKSHHSLHAAPVIVVAVTRGKVQCTKLKAADSFAFHLVQ